MENPIKMDDLGVPPFKETSIYSLNFHFQLLLLSNYMTFSLKFNGQFL